MAEYNQLFCEQVSTLLVEQLKRGTAPWQMPSDFGEYKVLMPRNPITSRRYKSINAIYLMAQNYPDNRWMTAKQAEEADAYVMPGEKGTQIQCWKFIEERSKIDHEGRPILDADGQPIKEKVQLERPQSFITTVFNAAQFDGLIPRSSDYTSINVNGYERVISILESSGVTIHQGEQSQLLHQKYNHNIYVPNNPHNQDLGSYNSDDFIDNCYKYYTTALRELSHWTGHPDHLERDLTYPIGSEGYAKEKLRVEIACMILGDEMGIGHDPSQQTPYVNSWVKILQDDPYEIFQAARDAEKICDYLLLIEQNQIQTQVLQPDRKVIYDQSMQQALPVTNQDDMIYIDVPYEQKDDAKDLGARWDPQKRSWYVSTDMDLALFKKWQPVIDVQQPQSKLDKSTQLHQYLVVPYEEHQMAKAEGALWDKVAKSWYIGPQADAVKLERWKPENVTSYQDPAMRPEEEFMEVMKNAGCIITNYPIMDNEDHRIKVLGDEGNQTSGTYRGNLEGHPTGSIRNYRTSETVTWSSKGYSFDVAQKTSLQVEMTKKLTDRTEQKAQQQEQTAQRVSTEIADLLPITTPTPYLKAKGIEPQAGIFIDQIGGTTYVPAVDENGKQWTTQYIKADGQKLFAKGGRKFGCFNVVGGFEKLETVPTIVISEGYATAASVSQALSYSTVAAFDAGNLKPVALALHKKYPNKSIVIAGDDDRHLEFKLGVNPGKEKALAAAKAVGGEAIFPVFASKETAYPKDLPLVTPQNYRKHLNAIQTLEHANEQPGSVQLSLQQEAELKKARLSSEQLAALSNMKKYTDFNDLETKSLMGVDGLRRQVKSAVDKFVNQAHKHQEINANQRSAHAQRQVRAHAAHL